MVDYNLDGEIHHKLNFIATAYTTLHNEIIKRRLPEDDFTINIIKKTLHEISKITHQFSEETKTRETFRMPDEFLQLIQTMKFIAKRMDKIETRFKELEGLEFNHSINISIDSKELDKFNNTQKRFDPYALLLESLPERIANILKLRYGIYGPPNKNSDIAKKIGCSTQQVSFMASKGLIICRHSSKKKFAQDLPEGALKNAIMGVK